MPSKTEEYLALAQRTANGLTRYWESWTDYLTTASRLYKYPFADQLMIYAQRPDATACADFDIWNTRIYHEMKLTPAMVKSIRTLCGVCLRHYVETKAFKIAIVPNKDRCMETCTVCQTRRGYDYVVMPR
ncbi:hypothetical protein [Faecalibacterium prausnitzii]|jgi:hypothetical protein|nr:hypothetical protein [Faecalibacterium prausnitzii]